MFLLSLLQLIIISDCCILSIVRRVGAAGHDQQLCCGQEQVVKLGGVSLDHQPRGEVWRGSESVMISLLQARPETAYWTWQGRRVTA